MSRGPLLGARVLRLLLEADRELAAEARAEGCPCGGRLHSAWYPRKPRREGKQTELFIATTKEWKQRKELPAQGPPRGRIPINLSPRERMERKLRTKAGRAIYEERNGTVEPTFGQMVMRGLDRFHLRGLRGAAGEWSLFSTTHNLLKLWRAGRRRSAALEAAPA